MSEPVAFRRTTTGSLSATQECRDTNCITRTTASLNPFPLKPVPRPACAFLKAGAASTHDHPAAQPSSDQRISGSADQRISGSADQRIRRSADQRIIGSADQRIIGSAHQPISPSAHQRISGSAEQRIIGSADQRISGSAVQRIIGSADQRISGSCCPAIIGSADQRIIGSADQRIRGSCAPYPPGTHACYAHTCTDSFDRRIDLACQYTCMASGCRIIQHLSQGLQVTSTERVHWLLGIEVFRKSDSWPMAPFRFSFAHSMLHSCPTAPAEA